MILYLGSARRKQAKLPASTWKRSDSILSQLLLEIPPSNQPACGSLLGSSRSLIELVVPCHLPLEIESVNQKPHNDKGPGPDIFPGEFYKTFKEDLIPILCKLLTKLKRMKRKEFFKLIFQGKHYPLPKALQEKKIIG